MEEVEPELKKSKQNDPNKLNTSLLSKVNIMLEDVCMYLEFLPFNYFFQIFTSQR